MRYRKGAVFVMDTRQHVRAFDRNEVARILHLAEALERSTKAPGRRNGVLGYAGLAVLRALLLRFHNRSSGLCCPSYTAIQCATGLCRQTIATALARLEAAGVLAITRRIVRQRVCRLCPITGMLDEFVATVQASNLYAIHPPGPHAAYLQLPTREIRRPFPGASSLAKLARMFQRAHDERLQAESSRKGETNSPFHKTGFGGGLKGLPREEFDEADVY